MKTRTASLVVVTTLFLCRLLPAQDASQRPNILWIMSDDHAAHAIGAYGGRLARLNPTPNLDRLAREGIGWRMSFV